MISMSGTKSLLAVSSTSCLLDVGESLDNVDAAVSIYKMFYWEVNTLVSRGCVKGMVTDRRF